MNPSQPSSPTREWSSLPPRCLSLRDHTDTAVSTVMLYLEMDGHEVHITRDGVSALKVEAEHHPDVILLDIGLPRMSGYEVAERLKGRKAQRKLLLIAVTGYGQERDRERSAAAGIDIHLLKPVDPVYLRRASEAVRDGVP